VPLSPTDAVIGFALAIQLVATGYFCLFGAYCYTMVGIHARHRETMRARDASVIANWSPAPDALPRVTVQLPLYNEQFVVSRLIESIIRFDYPRERLEIQVLDDSTDVTTQIASELVEKYRREGFDIVLLRRTDRTGYKAGALKEGHAVAKGEFIAIFDADFVPDPDFLRKTLPFFEDPGIAAVQTLWGHLNAGYSQMTLAQSVGLDGINYVLQSAQCWVGSLMHFQGTAGVWRKGAIDDAGGWQWDTLTEDLDLSYRAQIRGWRMKYLPQVICPGELPATIAAAKTQQHRWSKGGFQTMQKLLPDILRSNLPLFAKVEATFYMITLLLQPSLLLIALSWPAQMWLREGMTLSQSVLPVIVLLALCLFGPATLFIYAQKQLYPDWVRRIRYYVYLMIWGTGVAVTNTRAIFEAMLGIRTGFVRTPKYRIEGHAGSFIGKAYRSKLSKQTLVEAVLGLYCLYGVGYTLLRDRPMVDPLLIIFTIGITMVTVKSVWEPLAQRRGGASLTSAMPSSSEVEVSGRPVD
jgi:cellulose synthase/poly-beta-1,6-N-acetylglucosamine synthase-like glycosyltransferase